MAAPLTSVTARSGRRSNICGRSTEGYGSPSAAATACHAARWHCRVSARAIEKSGRAPLVRWGGGGSWTGRSAPPNQQPFKHQGRPCICASAGCQVEGRPSPIQSTEPAMTLSKSKISPNASSGRMLCLQAHMRGWRMCVGERRVEITVATAAAAGSSSRQQQQQAGSIGKQQGQQAASTGRRQHVKGARAADGRTHRRRSRPCTASCSLRVSTSRFSFSPDRPLNWMKPCFGLNEAREMRRNEEHR